MERTGLGLNEHHSPSPRTNRRIGLRIAPLIGIELLVAATFATLSRHAQQPVGRPLTIALFAVGFACAGAFNMRLEFRRHQFTFTLAEAVLTVSFFALGPIGIGLAAALGELVSLAAQRVSPLKTLYNVGNRLASAIVAATAFQAFGHLGADNATAWGFAIGAAICFSCLDTIFTAAVVATVERSSFGDVLARSAGTAALTTLGAAPLGVIALTLSQHSILAPLLLVPLVAAVMFNSRHAAAQRDEHLRFERLHEASSRTAHVVDLDDALRLLAIEANGLATGLGAICCTTNASGDWIGVTVDDAGWRRASSGVVQELLGMVADGESREVALERSTPALRRLLPDAASVVVAGASSGQAAPIAIAVLREGNPDIGAEARVQTLSAFANHASLTTANARLYAELESALARQVDLNRQKGDFVATVSHELRTPLAVMLAANHTLRKLADRIPETKRLELLDASIEQGNRLQRLIDELLLVAAAEHESVEVITSETALDPLVAEIETELRSTTGGRLQVCSPRPLGRVMADPDRLRQILQNLVDNASKYAPTGPIELSVETVGDEVRLALVDHGPGIPEADRARVFEQFVQLDQTSTRRQGGTGLGLYVCRQLATLLGGTLELEETPGGGCHFTLTLRAAPALDDPVPPTALVASVAAAAPSAGFSAVRARPAEFARPPGARPPLLPVD
ncbi:MAG TPA: HAMP domain-containing sensor histidine kinase [Acidimicrobiia bacterium]